MIFEEFQIQITMWFENHHHTFFDIIFTIFTELGDITFLLFLFMYIYWNISKKVGLKLVFGLALSFGINTGIKESVRNIRPFYREGITKGLTKEVAGYSFPSGHSQNVGTLWTMLIIESKRKWITFIGLIMIVMVPLSRVYLRVHWLQDVIVGVLLGIIIAIVYEEFLSEKLFGFFTHSLVITFMTPMTFFTTIIINNPDVAKGFGVFAGVIYGYWFEMKYVDYQPSGSKLVKGVRFVLGAVGLVALQTMLKLSFPQHIYMEYLRYYILGTYITFMAPYVFSKIEKIK